MDRGFHDAIARGIRAVPDIVVNETHKLAGVQDTITFLEIFLRIKKSAGDVSVIQELNKAR